MDQFDDLVEVLDKYCVCTGRGSTMIEVHNNGEWVIRCPGTCHGRPIAQGSTLESLRLEIAVELEGMGRR